MFWTRASRRTHLEKRQKRLLKKIDGCERRMAATTPAFGTVIVDDLDVTRSSNLSYRLGKVNDKVVKFGGTAVTWNWNWQDKLKASRS
jgi:hypothetical protein